MSQDPLAFAAGDANLYRYVHNDSLNLLDSSGLAERKVNLGDFLDGLKKKAEGSSILKATVKNALLSALSTIAKAKQRDVLIWSEDTFQFIPAQQVKGQAPIPAKWICSNMKVAEKARVPAPIRTGGVEVGTIGFEWKLTGETGPTEYFKNGNDYQSAKTKVTLLLDVTAEVGIFGVKLSGGVDFCDDKWYTLKPNTPKLPGANNAPPMQAPPAPGNASTPNGRPAAPTLPGAPSSSMSP